MNNRFVTQSITCLFLVLVFITNAFGQEEQKPIANLRSPKQAVITHLKYLQEETYHPSVSAQALDTEGLSPREAEKLAMKIKQIYDGIGQYINVDAIPDNPNFTDSTTQQQQYVVVSRYPQLYLQKVGNQWKYSQKSVAQINQIHQEVYPFFTHKFLELENSFGQSVWAKEYLGLKLWQHIALMLLVFASFLAHKVFTFFFSRVLNRILIRFGQSKLADQVLTPVARPLSLLLIAQLLKLTIPLIQIPIVAGRYVITLVNVLVPFFVVMVVYRLIDVLSFYLEKAAQKTDSTLDDQLVPIIRKSLKIFVIIAGVVFILQNLNFNITGLIAGLSIGGLAFALAAQDTIKNLFGSLMIFIDRPFQVGDWVIGSNIDGSVEEVGFRSTRIRTFHNSVVSVPNGHLADMTIDNMGLRSYRRFSTQLSITYDTPPEKIEIFIEGLRQLVKNHPDTLKDNFHIYLNSFGNSSLNILFYIFFNVPDWGKELNARHEVMLQIIHLAETLEVRFAFPTSTLHVENFPEKQSLTPLHELNQEELQTKLAALYEMNGKKKG
ncbi:mechanosensitive ion channel family protein [Rapidithrix thailandica]|uniref:Mechanosensitive ion channel family protein n=1 Tax=Rapidithrix thailandica TaxID=413964 RepID=A0AAW9S3M6_9BACT